MAELDEVTTALERIAPLRGAGGWDNVGLLLRGTRAVRRIGLCIDLTEPVYDELAAHDVDLVLSYHPPIFKGLQRITGATGLERTLLALIRGGRHLYSPHTALDAAKGGMGEWLAGALGEGVDVAPIQPLDDQPDVGVGRMGRLARPQPLSALLSGIRTTLGIRHLRVAGDLSTPRRSFAVCPGSGGSVFAGAGPFDLLLTGELGHHDVLAQVARGGAVVLTDHTNCERGYLAHYSQQIQQLLPKVEVLVSARDADPLQSL